MDDNQRVSLLKDEYLHIQSVIHDFDGRALTIKAWSVSFSLAAIGGAFAAHANSIFLVASFSALLFWLVEAIWKSTQYAFYDRSGKLEQFFAGKQQQLVPMQVGSSWYAHYKKGRITRLLRILCWARVALPHAPVALLGLVLFGLASFNIITV